MVVQRVREILNDYIRNEFARQQLTTKYGVIHSIRMPFKQEIHGPTTYFGFMTMADTKIHEAMLKDMETMGFNFGEQKLKFEKADSLRAPHKRRRTSEDEEEVRIITVKKESGIGTIKEEPTHSQEDRELKIRQREEEIRQQEESILAEREINEGIVDKIREERAHLDKWEKDLQERERAYWAKRLEDYDHVARLRFLDLQVIDLQK